MVKITAEVTEPLNHRPAEGMLKISVDLSPMAAPNMSDTRSTLDENVELVRLLERSIRESKCVDMEGLCLEAGHKCWRLRADVIALNSEGNLIEACSIGLIAALAHFRRPDVSLTNEKLIIHSVDEKIPIPLTMLHFPFCVQICLFSAKEKFIIDPLDAEEEASDGYVAIAGNSYREITTVHVSSKALLNQDKIMKCCQTAVERIKCLTTLLKSKLHEDKLARESKQEMSFASQLRKGSLALSARYVYQQETKDIDLIDYDVETDMVTEEVQETKAYRFSSNVSGIGEGGRRKWDIEEDDDCQILDPKPLI